MTFEAEKVKTGRRPFTIVEMDLDYCSLTHGTAPCTATETGDSQCFNTRSTCNDPANYTRTTQTYKFCTVTSDVPLGEGLIPTIARPPSFSSTRLEPDKGIGARGTVSIKALDFTWSDRDMDPYIDDRTYDPKQRGTFWGKFKARNRYYTGRIMRVKTGYLTDPFDSNNFKTRTYFIERIDGPDRNGLVTIKGKDILTFVDDKAATVPAHSAGQLSAALTAGATSFTITPSGEGANYPSSGTVRIGDEIINYSSRSGDTFSSATRGAYNTEAKAHDQDDIVQLCYTMNNMNVVAFIDEMLETYGGIDGDTYIPYDAGLTTPTGTNDEWDDEQSDWLSSWNLTGIISEPTGVKKILAEVGESCNLGIWWNPTEASIKLKANVPPRATETVTTLTAENHLIEKSVQVKDLPEKRVSRVYVWYGEINPVEDRESSNMQFLEGDIDSDTEGADKHNKASIKQIYARFFDSSNAGEAASLSGRILNRFSETPMEVRFSLDAKDESLEVGDLVSLETDAIQDARGQNTGHQLQIIEAKEKIPGHLYEYKGLTSRYTANYARIGPDTLGEYDVESDANKAAYAWICYDTGIFASDGAAAYRII